MENKPRADNDRPITIRELNEKSRCSISTLRRLVRDRKIPYFQPAGKGGKLSFPPDAVERTCILPDGLPRQPTDSGELTTLKHLSGSCPEWMKSENMNCEDHDATEKQ